MNIKTFFSHRLRDIDAVLRSEQKGKLFFYVLLRQLYKIVNINEVKIKSWVKDSKSKLYGFYFQTRKNSIDFLFCSKYYEPETSAFLRSMKGKTFFDVGGHIGRFAILGSQSFEKVYVFEPQPSNYKSLTSNISLNNIKNITAINAAVSDKQGTVTLSDLSENTGWVYISDQGTIESQCLSLDNFVATERIDIQKIDLILIDAEGHEVEVLLGAIEIFKNASPQILMESFDVNKVDGLLHKYGYKRVRVLDSYNHLYQKI